MGLACGGRACRCSWSESGYERDLFERLLAERTAKRAVTLVTRLADGAQALVIGDDISANSNSLPGRATRSAAGCAATRAARWILQMVPVRALLLQPPRMIIVGAVHITRALAPMAAMAGFEVVVDPRRAFATT